MKKEDIRFKQWPIIEQISLLVQILAMVTASILAIAINFKDSKVVTTAETVYALPIEEQTTAYSTTLIETTSTSKTTLTTNSSTTSTTTIQSSIETTTETTVETIMLTTTEIVSGIVEEEVFDEVYEEIYEEYEDVYVVEEEIPNEEVQTELTIETTIQEEIVSETEITTTTQLPVYQVSESDYVLLCNCVAHEAGSNYISTQNKAKVVEVILNRVASAKYPNTIYGVITQKYQFSGAWSYVNLETFSSAVTEDVKLAVTNYLNGVYPNHGYMSFRGNGRQNYFK